MKQKITTLKKSLLLLMFSLTAASYTSAQTSVFDVIEGSVDHDTLEVALEAAGLDLVLDDQAGEYTVFAPTDAAFKALPEGTIAALLGDPLGDLTNILTYHVVGAEALAGSLSDGDMFTTLQGRGIDVTINPNGVFINDAKVTVTDLTADNGVVHVIDAILMPPTSVVDIIVNSADHDTLEVAVIAAGLVPVLDDLDGEFTVFAPTDAAFKALPEGTIGTLLGDPLGDLTTILTYHVVGAEALAGSLSDEQVFTTLSTEDITISLTGGVFVNAAEVTTADLQADNGVVHVIDAVLLPPTITSIAKEETTLEASIAPNPAENTVNINVEDFSGNAQVEIRTLDGSLQNSWNLTEANSSLNISSLNTGMYMMTVKENSKIYTAKLMIK